MPKKTPSPNVIIEPNKPDLAIEVRYYRKSATEDERLLLIWKTKKQPHPSHLTVAQTRDLNNLLLKLARSAFEGD